MSGGNREAVAVAVEKEELGLGPGHHLEAHLPRSGHNSLEGGARTSGEGRSVGVCNIADQPCHLALVGLPGEDLKGLHIGHQEHVRFLDPRESLDRRAVEHDLAVQSLLELTRRHLDVFDDAVDIGELKAEEMDVFFTCLCENGLGCFWHFESPESFVLRILSLVFDKVKVIFAI